MSDFQVLDAGDARERYIWMSVWNSWKDWDVAGNPDYIGLFARPVDRVCCALLHSEQGGVIFPFILRPIAAEKWAQKNDASFDIVSPYGYGGPFLWGNPEIKLFWHNFEEWARQKNVISCFIRLSLFQDIRLDIPGDIQHISDNVVRSLSFPIEDIWFEYEHKVRKNVKKARNYGVDIIVDTDGSRLNDFLMIYQETMNRRNAASGYYFSVQFFKDIVARLPGQFAFFHAIHDGKVVSTELVLVSQKYIYSFLGGTLAEAFSLRPNDLLKHTVIEWGIKQGKEAFILGGGYGENDGIFQYKKSFAPEGIVPFKVSKYILNSDAYDVCCQLRRKYETDNGNDWMPNPGYFPAYRG